MDKKNSQDKSQVKVEILGEEYNIKADESSEYIINIAAFVDEHMQEIKENAPSTPRNRVILLGAMNLADKLYKVQKENEKVMDDNKKLENSSKKLISENNRLKKKYQEIKDDYDEFLELIEKGELG
ncbi:cell division protein ZapA [Halonatronum saccharophilum]|uniref:cell division protein ZapA n=1 Tax=Halonatronum saccharophilum TaxID=150060 RepID=UPI000485AEA4|nr:cell division protein ZapA [Halonatronum saccharophilum]